MRASTPPHIALKRACDVTRAESRSIRLLLRRRGAEPMSKRPIMSSASPTRISRSRTKANPLIIAEGQRNIGHMTVSEAVMHLDLSEAAFMIFRNSGHGGLNVVYRRGDGHIGWIDAELPFSSKPNGASAVKSVG